MNELPHLHMVWKDGKTGAVTSSWDDGTAADRRLVALFNRHGLKATWNLNAGKLGLSAAQSGFKDYVRAEEVAALYVGHEVACHSFNHPHLAWIPLDAVRSEVIADRMRLESLVGYPVTGMVLPYGPAEPEITALVAACGIRYLRQSRVRPRLGEPPEDFLRWGVTCHYREQPRDAWEQFLSATFPGKLFYFWGHSFELDKNDDWQTMEKLAAMIGGRQEMWHATNGEIYEYVMAWRRLVCSLDMRIVKNESAQTLFFRVKDRMVQLAPGQLLRL